MSIARELRVISDTLAELSAQVNRLAKEVERQHPEPVEPWHGQARPSTGPYRQRIFQ